jgi:hypothetical protein
MGFVYGKSERRNPLQPKVGRQRQVFPTGEIPHKWAHATQAEARNAQSNLYFRGDTIFSYRDSWPLGRIYRKRGAEPFVLLNSGRYSVTTAGHQSMTDRACSHMASVSVPYVAPAWGYKAPDHEKNLAHLARIAADALGKAKRVMSAGAVSRRMNVADHALIAWRSYATFFGIRREAPDSQRTAWAAALDRAKAIESPDPVRDAKRFKARQARGEATARKFAESIDRWRNNGAAFPYQQLTRGERLQWRALPCMLRVNGDQIETLQGARIPLDHAPRLWQLIRRAMAGHPYQHNGHSEHAGEFKIDSVDAAGTLKAGCHVIPYAELERMARTLGLIEAPAQGV